MAHPRAARGHAALTEQVDSRDDGDAAEQRGQDVPFAEERVRSALTCLMSIAALRRNRGRRY
jgi:hypothetical protein